MSRENEILNSLREQGALRSLVNCITKNEYIIYEGKQYVNLSSNDYLGIGSRVDLQKDFLQNIDPERFVMSGSSSRLMCGNNEIYTELEDYIATMYQSEAALVLGSGYLLNSSILRAVCDKDDVILADKLVHSSLVDGLQLAPCKWERFKHNDMQNLENLLVKYQTKRVFVVIETLYSMDGDFANVDAILELKNKYDFVLIADEAHAFGVFGKHGCGVIKVGQDVDYRIVTLGKAAGSTGAFVVCSKDRKELMVNKLKSVIYSTALPPINIMWTLFLLDKIINMDQERAHLQNLIALMGGQSQIIPIPCSGNDNVKKLVLKLKDCGFWVTAIRYPTVALGSERIRISLCSSIQTNQLEKLCELIG